MSQVPEPVADTREMPTSANGIDGMGEATVAAIVAAIKEHYGDQPTMLWEAERQRWNAEIRKSANVRVHWEATTDANFLPG